MKGVVFFGVPHRGSDIAYWANFAASILEVFALGRTNKRFISALKQNSKTFADISRQFIERAASLEIRTFYETEMMLYNQLVCFKFTLVSVLSPF